MAAQPKIPVLVVVGTRPEAIKLVPLIVALRESESFRPVVVSTGQHQAMVLEVFALAGIRPDVDLWIGGAHGRLNNRVASELNRFEDYVTTMFGDHHGEPATDDEIIAGQYPAAVLVHGDTTSAMAAALGAFHLRIPVMHIEAGLRTGGVVLSPFPEELNRQLISCIACMHFAPTPRNEENLVRENIPADQIFVTGNTGIDALMWAAGLETPFTDPRVAEVHDSEGRIVFVTGHRRENWGGGLARIGEGVAMAARAHPDVHFVLPLHPNPAVRAELKPPLEGVENVLLTESLGYASVARLLKRCEFAISDSGGIQEEAPALGKPVLVTRESTERTEGVEVGTLRLVGTEPTAIAAAAGLLLDDEAEYRAMASVENPYGDGAAAERIVGALEFLHGTGPAPAPFGTGFTRAAVFAAAGYDGRRRPLEPPPADDYAEHFASQ